jgi:hypothetical protein
MFKRIELKWFQYYLVYFHLFSKAKSSEKNQNETILRTVTFRYRESINFRIRKPSRDN